MNWTTLQQDPIPAEIIDTALNLLVEIGHIEGSHRTTGTTWLAERVNVDRVSVSRWRHNHCACTGSAATLTKMVLTAQLREGIEGEARRLEGEAMDLDQSSKTAFEDEDYDAAEELSEDSAELVAQAAELREQLATLTD